MIGCAGAGLGLWFGNSGSEVITPIRVSIEDSSIRVNVQKIKQQVTSSIKSKTSNEVKTVISNELSVKQ